MVYRSEATFLLSATLRGDEDVSESSVQKVRKKKQAAGDWKVGKSFKKQHVGLRKVSSDFSVTSYHVMWCIFFSSSSRIETGKDLILNILTFGKFLSSVSFRTTLSSRIFSRFVLDPLMPSTPLAMLYIHDIDSYAFR